MIRHNYGLRPISIGLLLILAVLLLTSCDKKEETVLQIETIIIAPEEPAEAPKDENKYTKDGRKLPTLKENIKK